MKIKIDLNDFKRLTRDLERTAKSALPHAMRNALNDAAFRGRQLWVQEIEREFILRNTFTTRTLEVRKAVGTNMQSMRSELGSRQEYMATQEHGGVDHGSVPTTASSGEGRQMPPRKKLVRQPNKLAAIALGQRYRRGSRKQRNAVALHMAAATGKKFVFLDLERRKGLFRVSGGKRIKQIDLVWDTTSKAHQVHAHPTLAPAVRRVQAELPRIMTRALVDQLKRHKVFGY
jgi:hypothetical protein